MTEARTAGWRKTTFVGFDLETTGVSPHEDRIVTASLVRVGPDGQRTVPDRNWLVNPGVPIPEAATAVHHVTNEQAQASGADPATAVAEITAALVEEVKAGHPIVVFNAPYDLTMIAAEAVRHGVPSLLTCPAWPEALVLDPLVIDRGVDRFRRGKRTLTAMTEHYGIELTDAHTADADSYAACLLARHLVTLPQLADVDGPTVMARQAAWRAAWAANFEDYLHRQGKLDATVDGSWPIAA